MTTDEILDDALYSNKNSENLCNNSVLKIIPNNEEGAKQPGFVIARQKEVEGLKNWYLTHYKSKRFTSRCKCDWRTVRDYTKELSNTIRNTKGKICSAGVK